MCRVAIECRIAKAMLIVYDPGFCWRRLDRNELRIFQLVCSVARCTLLLDVTSLGEIGWCIELTRCAPNYNMTLRFTESDIAAVVTVYAAVNGGLLALPLCQ